tara:strand:- start:1265 stop:1420 length:156 start_codon:yes stop_codon:yes gene_type:complete
MVPHDVLEYFFSPIDELIVKIFKLHCRVFFDDGEFVFSKQYFSRKCEISLP